jgi:hypothetical protein
MPVAAVAAAAIAGLTVWTISRIVHRERPDLRLDERRRLPIPTTREVL